MSEFGEYIKKIRKKRGLTINQLALYSGISSSQLSRIETGKRGVPKPSTIEKLSTSLKVDYNELMRIAGYIDPPIFNEVISGHTISLTTEELEVLKEIRKHPVAFENLKENPEKNVKQMIKSWKTVQEMMKEIDDDDGEYLE